ncbi:secreted protein [Labedaea rhizosphaerae]|uniref:Secreted protein n=2 Tax=Labedaea rhizosphaerae TaxID=598644 RepID=A0A4R6SQ05_LABRH|nr:secreted protein [Labedaea rhizosphaerae]
MTGPAEPIAPADRLPARIAALVGVLGVFAAVAAGHLVGGLVGGDASPFRAVANQVRDRSPDAVVEWAKQTLGTSDKFVAQLGVAVVLVLLGVLAGLLSRKVAWPGLTLAVVLGITGIVAVLQQRDVGQLGVLAPVAGLVAGASVFGWLHRLALARVENDTPAAGVSRRTFLKASGGTAAGAGIAVAAGQWLADSVDVEGSRASVGKLVAQVKAPPLPAGADFAADGTPTFLTANADFYRIDTAFVLPRITAQDWKLRIHGMVDKELTLSYADLRRFRLVERDVTLTCVSNEVGGDLISTARFVGVPIHEVLDLVGVRQGAQQLLSTSKDGWTCSTPVDVLQDPERMALLAIGMNGEPLPLEHGFPVRQVVPGLYGYVSATKWVVDWEFTTFSGHSAYWTDRGWSEQGPIKTESRIDTPKDGASVGAGKVTVAGIAWAQNTGIDKVEVRVDKGPWQQAELSTEVTDQAWRMWRVKFDVPPGTHTAAVRATDRDGYTQTEHHADPVPDGATGWHSVEFDAK